MNVYSRTRRVAALICCLTALSLGGLAVATPAQAAINPNGAVPTSGAVTSDPTAAAAYSVIPASDLCPSGTIVKMFGNTINQVCIFAPGTFPAGGPYTTLVSFVPNRVWLHQHLNGSGWADCFRDPFYPNSGAAWNVAGSRDANPGNILVSLNTATC